MSLRVHEVCSFLLLSVFHSAGVVTAYLSPVERHRDHSQFLADIMTFFSLVAICILLGIFPGVEWLG